MSDYDVSSCLAGWPFWQYPPTKVIFGHIFEVKMLNRRQTTTFLQIFSKLSLHPGVIFKSMRVADDRLFWKYLPTKALFCKIFQGQMLIRSQKTTLELLQIFSGIFKNRRVADDELFFQQKH